MGNQVPFQDREAELALIEQAIAEWGTRRVICIQGDGGIGKTRLLQEVYDRHSRTAPAGSAKKITIALVQELTDSEWSQEFIAGAREAALQIGADLLETDAGSVPGKMTNDLEQVIEQSPNAIIISLGNNADLRPGMQRAVDAGIKVLTFDNYVSGVTGLACRVSQDNLGGARASLERLAADLDYRGEIAVLWVPGFEPLARRESVLDAVVAQYPDMSVLEKCKLPKPADTASAEANSYAETKRLLQAYPDLRAIWVTWNVLARGVVRALRDGNRSDVLVYSFDLCPTDVDLMVDVDSPWRATVGVDPQDSGRTIVCLAALAVAENTIKPWYSLRMSLHTQGQLRLGRANQQQVWQGPSDEIAEVQSRARALRRPQRGVLLTGVIDFDDNTFHIAQNVGYRIAQMVDETVFRDYLRGLADYRRMEEHGVSPEGLQVAESALNRTFVECFNTATANRRTVLRFDTAEKVSATNVWAYLRDRIPGLRNTLVLIAGRNDHKDDTNDGTMDTMYEDLCPMLGSDVQLLPLSGLQSVASQSYLKSKQDLLHLTLEPQLVSKILLLANGRPILIDLAVEWQAREQPLRWLTRIALDKLQALPDAELEKRRDQFERSLVTHIGDIGRKINRLFLTMARVFPLDAEEIGVLLSLPAQEATELLEEAKSYAFVKTLPGGRVSLHDEMRRMVNEYVWPRIDPGGHRQRRDSRVAVGFLERKTAELEDRIRAFDCQKQAAEERQDMEAAYAATMEREVQEREVWALQEHMLSHQLYTDVQLGVTTFADLFDRATKGYRLPYREVLLNTMTPFLRQLSSAQYSIVAAKQIEYLTDARDYQAAMRIIKRQQRQQSLTEEQRVSLLMQRGDVETRQRDLEAAVRSFRSAARICSRQELPEQLVQAEKGQGYAYRLMADHEKAHAHYVRAQRLALDQGNRAQEAQVSNNMAFLHTLRPVTQDKALQMSDRAIYLWQELGGKRGLGAAFNTRASILYRFGRYEEALTYFEKALAIFQPENDWEWLSSVYSWRGVTYWAMARFDPNWQTRAPECFEKARLDLELARDHVLPRDEAMTLNRLARVYCDLGRYRETEELALRSYQLARDAKDREYEVVALDMLAHLALCRDDRAALPELELRTESYKQRYLEKRRDNITLGRLSYHLGTLSLLVDDPVKALEYYRVGFVLMALYSVYGWMSLPDTLRRLDESVFQARRYAAATPEFIRRLGADLYSAWRPEALGVKAPEALSFFARWQRWPDQNGG